MNKTFKDLQKGDKIYAVVTGLPKITVAELIVTKIQKVAYGITFDTIPVEEGIDEVKRETVYLGHLNDDKCKMWRYVYWHTNKEAARNTIKETIKYRIKKKEETIREAKRALENYKQLLKEYEQDY